VILFILIVDYTMQTVKAKQGKALKNLQDLPDLGAGAPSIIREWLFTRNLISLLHAKKYLVIRTH
jgi:hypothetical protein